MSLLQRGAGGFKFVWGRTIYILVDVVILCKLHTVVRFWKKHTASSSTSTKTSTKTNVTRIVEVGRGFAKLQPHLLAHDLQWCEWKESQLKNYSKNNFHKYLKVTITLLYVGL